MGPKGRGGPLRQRRVCTSGSRSTRSSNPLSLLAEVRKLRYHRPPVHRSLRFQLVVSVLFTVVVSLGVSQWLGNRLSERALEQDFGGRELLVVNAVDSLWQHTNRKQLRRHLTTLTKGQRPIHAIDVFRLRGGRWKAVATTRSPGNSDDWQLGPEEGAQLEANLEVRTALPALGGIPGWRLVSPLRRADTVTGAVQVDVRPTHFTQLRRRLRTVDWLVVASSIAVVSLLLTLLLERGVTRPVAALVDGMRRAERGDLGARVAPPRSAEFRFLTRGFNSMLVRLQDLTTGLEARVEQATRQLAAKNVELQAVNEKLSDAQFEAGRTERLAAHGQMAATIAHELGTPLNSVLGYTQLLLREEAVPERAEKLAVIESQVQRMADTIRSMLDQARDQSLEHAPVAITPLVEESLALLSARLASRSLTVQTRIAPDLPPVRGDATGLRQVLINLLTNAIDATQPTGTITVGAAVLPSDDPRPRHVELTVCDTGHGMTAEELRRACEPFYTTKVPGHGTGLGLVVVDHIVRGHRGRLLIESTCAQGTTVRVQLPAEG